jgi:hypothetical protein
MNWTFSWATELNPVLVYSAVVSTAVLGWSIYTYLREGPRLRFAVGGNRQFVGQGNIDHQTYIMYSVVNAGTAATTLTGIGLYVYDNRWRRFRRKSAVAYVATMASASPHNFPHILEPGHAFTGLSFQTPEIVKLAREKLVYVTLSHTMAKREIFVRLGPIEVATQHRI